MSGRRGKRNRGSRSWLLVLFAVAAVVLVSVLTVVTYHGTSQPIASRSSTSTSKYVILYVNQGNGAVNESNFGSMVSFASSHGFNTIFFQVYRQGDLLFTTSELSYFVSAAHTAHMTVFFSLYVTDSSQQLPTSIYPLGEDGITLDMSTLPLAGQTALFDSLKQAYQGTNAITTTDLTLPLSPDLLVLETYSPQIQQYSQHIHPGVIASVGVFATTDRSNYEQQVNYAIENSDGVMVFDYAGLLKSGY